MRHRSSPAFLSYWTMQVESHVLNLILFWKEREMTHPQIHFPNAHSSQGWARLKQGTRNWIQVSHVVTGTQIHEPSAAAYQSTHYQQDTLMWNVGSPRGVLTTVLNTYLQGDRLYAELIYACWYRYIDRLIPYGIIYIKILRWEIKIYKVRC